MRLAASGLPFLARTLLECGEDFNGVPFTDPEASMDGIMRSGSTELVRDMMCGDSCNDAFRGVIGGFESGSSDCPSIGVLRRRSVCGVWCTLPAAPLLTDRGEL